MDEEFVNVIGITGPTGSGKSEVSLIFKEHGYEIIDSDKLAKEIINEKETLEEVKKVFGDDIEKDGILDRKELAKRAFKSIEEEKKLNSIVHPKVLNRAEELIANYVVNGKYNIVFDVPLMFESNADLLCSVVISVIAPVEKRKDRIRLRDNISDEEIDKRISVQQSDDFYIEKSEYVIYNDSTMDDLKQKVIDIIGDIHGTTK